MKLDPTALEAAVLAARVTYITDCYSMRDAVTAALATIPEPTPAESQQPIDPADVRVGDRVRVEWKPVEGTVEDVDGDRNVFIKRDDGGVAWVRESRTTLYLLDRPDPRVAVVRAYYNDAAIGSSDDGIADLLARLDKLGTWEPRPTKGDLHA